MTIGRRRRRQFPRFSRLALALGLCLTSLTPAPAAAQTDPQITRPASAGRVVARFDFDDRRMAAGDVPFHWVRAQNDPKVPRIRPGFPIWNQARVVRDGPAVSGDSSIELRVRGGSCSLRLDPGVVPVLPSGDYLVTARVKTGDVQGVRPRLVARLLDGDGQPIPGSESSHSIAESPDEWTSLVVVIPGVHDNAEDLQIDIELVQQLQYDASRVSTDPLADRRVRIDDFDARAWFDDVMVIQLPRVAIKASSPGAVFVGDEPVNLDVLVRDLAGEQLDALLTLEDAFGNVIATEERTVNAGRSEFRWSPPTPGFGWYRSRLELFAQSGLVGGAAADFIRVPTPEPRAAAASLGDTGRFSLAFDSMSPPIAEALKQHIDAVGIGHVTLPGWGTDWRPGDARLEDRIDLTWALKRRGYGVAINFPTLPIELAASLRLDPIQVATGFTADRQTWLPYIARPLERLGEYIERWQLGWPETHQDRLMDADALTQIRETFADYTPGPVVDLATPITEPVPSDLLAPAASLNARRGLVVGVPPTLAPQAIADAAANWLAPLATTEGSPNRPRLSLLLERRESDASGAIAAASRITEQTVLAWKTIEARPDAGGEAGTSIALAQPWTTVGTRHPVAMATPELAAFRNASDRLVDRQTTLDYQPIPGVRGILLEPYSEDSSRGSALVLWPTDASAIGSTFVSRLAAGPVASVDVFGNATRIDLIQRSNELETHLADHHVPIAAEPIFIEGVDADLIRFLAGVRIEPAFIPAEVDEHRHNLAFSNPWKSNLAGMVVIAEPGGAKARAASERGWRVTPRRQRFTTPSNGDERLPLGITFSPAVEAGAVDFVVDLQLSTETEYGWVRVTQPIEMGLRDVAFELRQRQVPTGFVVEAVITNRGENPLTIELTAFPPGDAGRVRSIINGLSPTRTIVRAFEVRGEPDELIGQRVLVRLDQPGTVRRLNKSVILGDAVQALTDNP
ncbi:MAG: hypothetical protein AAF747_04310 [Planctomycetota bacterium]